MSVEYYEKLARDKAKDTCHHVWENHPSRHMNQECKRCRIYVRNEIAEWYTAGYKHGKQVKPIDEDGTV